MRAARALPLLALLAGCVDFVDPVGLRLQRDTAVEITLDLADTFAPGGCDGPGTVPADSAALCVTASVDPGYTVLGERLRLTDPTLRVLGEALVPTMDADSVLRYERRFSLPARGLETIPFTVRLPAVDGEEAPPEIRWFAVGRAGDSFLPMEPAGELTFRVELPAGSSEPPPASSFWSMDLSGSTARATYNGGGTPRASYRFPPEVLESLRGPEFRAELRWIRSLDTATAGSRVTVRFNQWIRWTARAGATAANAAAVSVVNR